MNSTSAASVAYQFELEDLLEPISVEHPAGVPLRYEGTYDRIREARREDDPKLSQGIYKTNLKKAEWGACETICVEALQNRTKDLQIAGWLLEAWLHLYFFAGVEAGLKLLAGLAETFWDNAYPELSGDNPEDRIAPIEWINDKLSLQLKQIPLTSPGAPDLEVYSYVDWDAACHLENLARKNVSALKSAVSNGKPTVASFQASVTSTDTNFYVNVLEDLNSATDACASLQELLNEKCGRQSPSLHQFRESLRDVQQLVEDVLHARSEDPSFAMEDQETTMGQELGHEPGDEGREDEPGLWSNGPIRSRAEAYHRLSEAADYLLRTEPHSPAPYLVKRAVEWGNMSLFELFQQIIRNDGEMQEIDRLLRLTRKEGG